MVVQIESMDNSYNRIPVLKRSKVAGRARVTGHEGDGSNRNTRVE